MLKRIPNIRTAKKLYNAGRTVYTLPCNVRLENVWIKPMMITEDFDKFVNACRYYNCNSELGNYLHFYIDKDI